MSDGRCPYAWGDFRCTRPPHDDGDGYGDDAHQLAWDGDEDDE